MPGRFVSLIRRFWTRSIRRQLILGIALVHAVLMSIFVFDMVERQRNFLAEQGIAQADGLANTLAASSVSWVLASDIEGSTRCWRRRRVSPACVTPW